MAMLNNHRVYIYIRVKHYFMMFEMFGIQLL